MGELSFTLIAVLSLLALIFFMAVKVIQEYERGVVFRLGRVQRPERKRG